jgi:hypothetical protein
MRTVRREIEVRQSSDVTGAKDQELGHLSLSVP